MEIKIGDNTYEGVAVLENNKKFKIKAKFKDDGDLVRIKTCHRSIDIEQAWKEKKFFKRLGKKSAEIVIDLNSPIETKEYCPIEIIAFSHSGKHSWFFADKKTEGEQLSAILRCNGKTVTRKGVSVCQVFNGLSQEIQFPGKTNVRAQPGCPINRIEDNLFEFRPTKGFCVYRFFNENKQYHRLTTLGYESIKLKK
jgi:hypothetical protein